MSALKKVPRSARFRTAGAIDRGATTKRPRPDKFFAQDHAISGSSSSENDIISAAKSVSAVKASSFSAKV